MRQKMSLQRPGALAGEAGAVVRALAFPMAGSPSASNTRRVIVKGFPFSVVYRPEAEGVIVFALAHHSRQPNYWRSRTRAR